MRVFIVDFGSQLNIMIPLANSLAEKAETILMLPNNSQPQLLSQISDKVKFQDFHLYRRRDPRNIQTLAKIMKTIKLLLLYLNEYERNLK